MKPGDIIYYIDKYTVNQAMVTKESDKKIYARGDESISVPIGDVYTDEERANIACVKLIRDNLILPCINRLNELSTERGAE